MPTYQYRCTDCGRDLEVVQKFSDASLTECPTCAGQLRKVFNAVGVVFKGSGFYRTDSRAAAGAGDSGGDKKTDKAAEKSGDTSDTKPAKVDAGASDRGTSANGKSAGGKSDGGKSDGGKVGAGTSSSSSTGSKAAAS